MRSRMLRLKRNESSRGFSLITGMLLFFSLNLLGCNQPVLESGVCIASRDSVKRFYSFHLGNDMAPTEENLEKRTKYLSEKLQKSLSAASDSKRDYFTQTEKYPKAFRAGKCVSKGNESASFEILLFWRTNEKNSQKEIYVNVTKEKENWVIEKVSSEK